MQRHQNDSLLPSTRCNELKNAFYHFPLLYHSAYWHHNSSLLTSVASGLNCQGAFASSLFLFFSFLFPLLLFSCFRLALFSWISSDFILFSFLIFVKCESIQEDSSAFPMLQTVSHGRVTVQLLGTHKRARARWNYFPKCSRKCYKNEKAEDERKKKIEKNTIFFSLSNFFSAWNSFFNIYNIFYIFLITFLFSVNYFFFVFLMT